MTVRPHLVPVVGARAAAFPAVTTSDRRNDPHEPDALARFVNNAASVAILHANGRALFTGVEAGEVTEYTQVSGTAITFTLELRDHPEEPVSVMRRLEEGARYTLTAKVDMEGRVTLALVREE